MKQRNRFLLVFGVLWGALFVSSLGYESPYFRPYERLQLGDAFRPDQRISMATYGDLAYRSNLPERRNVHETVFTTDAHGRRNPKTIERPPVVVCGDSYVVGAGLSDDETLSERLSVELGEPVYNHGCASPHSGPSAFLQDERFADHPPRVFVYAPAFRHAGPLEDSEPVEPRHPYQVHLDTLVSHVEEGNSLRRTCRRTWFTLTGAAAPTLIRVQGKEALVLSLGEQELLTSSKRDLDATVAALVELRDTLSERGTRLIYAPIPEVGTIYEDAYSEEQRTDIARPSFIDRLFERLEGRVEVIDLRPAFRASREPYLYRLDDTHWTPRGVRIAAQELATKMKRE